LDAASVTVQVGLVPLQESPPHPANTEVASGVAVNVIMLLTVATPWMQSEVQFISLLGVLTVPPPAPPKKIETVAAGMRTGGGGLSLPSPVGAGLMAPLSKGGFSKTPGCSVKSAASILK
jgi:hypothetical protein